MEATGRRTSCLTSRPRQHGIDFADQGFAVFNALVLAKVMLVAENLNLGRWLDRRPLIYLIPHDAFLFTVLFFVFHVAEEIDVGLLHRGTVMASVPAIGGGGALLFRTALKPPDGF